MTRPSSRGWPRTALLALAFAFVFLAVAAYAQVVLSDEAPSAISSAFLPVVAKPAPPTYRLVEFAPDIITDTITDIAHAGDERLFIAEREGTITIVMPDGHVLPQPFLHITGVGYQWNWEMGFVGLVFHPDYPAVPYFYVAYTGGDGRLYLARYEVDPTNPNKALPGSRKEMMVIKKPPDGDTLPSYVHVAGDMSFGADGFLYLALGDGGPDPTSIHGVPGDPFNNSQRLNTLWGKILRIDVDGNSPVAPDCGGQGYTIPPDNPYVGQGGCDEIWMTGLRNPWRFSFDRLTGDMWIGDVGEWHGEEINFIPAGTGRGANFGWHCWEGTVDYTIEHPELALQCGPDDKYTFPIHEYNHAQSDCSVVGGFVYRGAEHPALQGYYVYGDFCTGRLWHLKRQDGQWVNTPVGGAGFHVSTFGENVHGELFVGEWVSPGHDNGLYKVVP